MVAVQFGYDGGCRTARGLVFHLQFEVVRVQPSARYAVNVAQLEVPCGRIEIPVGIGLAQLHGLEQLQYETVRILPSGSAPCFRGKISHLIRLPIRPETKSHGQCFVFLHALSQGDIPEHTVEVEVAPWPEFLVFTHLKVVVVQAQ